MTLNPIWNQYSVAPIGNIIMIGHRRALQGGITRESALNLIAWLIISTEATPEEIAAEMDRAHDATPSKGRQAPSSVAKNLADARAQGKNAAAVAAVLARVPKPSGVAKPVKPDKVIPPSPVNVETFVGEIDDEEAEAIAAAESALEAYDDEGEAPVLPPEAMTKPVDVESLGKVWNGNRS